MAYSFTEPSRYLYKAGGIFLGLDAQDNEIGISTERNLITFASAGSGKGACLIVPNLKRWTGAALVVDPKGENATLTAGERAKRQSVGVLDPFHITQGDAVALRCAINPLSLLDPSSRSYAADTENLADGFIRRFDARHARWDNKAAAILAGLIDFVLHSCPPEQQNLLTVRDLLLQPDDVLANIVNDMLATPTPAGLSRSAAADILSKLTDKEGVAAGGWNIAVTETAWISDGAFKETLGDGDLPFFDLSTLKSGTGSLYLCVRADHLKSRGGFLRLFTQLGLMVMMTSLAGHGSPTGRCLFLLDEFFSLGRMDLITSAAGLMRGYGVQLWPFLQDLGQLGELYGEQAVNTYFANSDAQIFFGVNDQMTAGYVSRYLGDVTSEEIGTAPVGGFAIPITGATTGAIAGAMGKGASGRMTGAMVGGAVGLAGAAINMAIQASHQEAMAEFQQKAASVGRPRVAPDTIRKLLGKPDGPAVAPFMMIFAKAGDALLIRTEAYFNATVRLETQAAAQAAWTAKTQKQQAIKAEKAKPENRRRRWWKWLLCSFGTWATLFIIAWQNRVDYSKTIDDFAPFLFLMLVVFIPWRLSIRWDERKTAEYAERENSRLDKIKNIGRKKLIWDAVFYTVTIGWLALIATTYVMNGHRLPKDDIALLGQIFLFVVLPIWLWSSKIDRDHEKRARRDAARSAA